MYRDGESHNIFFSGLSSHSLKPMKLLPVPVGWNTLLPYISAVGGSVVGPVGTFFGATAGAAVGGAVGSVVGFVGCLVSE